MPSPVLMLAFVVKGKTLPQPPVAQHDGLGGDRLHPAGAAARPPPRRGPGRRRRAAGSRTTRRSATTVVVLQRRLEERVQHVEAGLVGREPGAHLLHATERADRDVPVRLPAPRAAPVLELQQLPRGLVDERLDRVLVAEPVAAGDRCRRCAPRRCRPRRSPRRHRPRPRRCGCASGRPSRPRRRRGAGRSRRWRWRRAGPRAPPPDQEHVMRGDYRVRHSPRSSSSTSTFPWWCTTRVWTLPSWNSSRWLWQPQENRRSP